MKLPGSFTSRGPSPSLLCMSDHQISPPQMEPYAHGFTPTVTLYKWLHVPLTYSLSTRASIEK